MARSVSTKIADVDLLPIMNLMGILIPTLLISTEYIKIVNVPVSQPQIGPSNPVDMPPPDVKPLLLTVATTSLGFSLFNGGVPYTPEGTAAAAADQAAGTATGPTVGKVKVTSYFASEGAPGTPEKLYLRVWEYKGKKYIKGTQEIADDKLEAKLKVLREKHGGFRQSSEEDFDYPRLNDLMEEIKKKYDGVPDNLKPPDIEKVTINGEPNTPFEVLVRVMDACRSRLNKIEMSAEEKAKFANDPENGKRLRKERGHQINKENELFPRVVLSAGIG